MEHINYTPETLYRIMRERMTAIEQDMADLEERLSRMREEHGGLYIMALAHDDPDAINGTVKHGEAQALTASPF